MNSYSITLDTTIHYWQHSCSIVVISSHILATNYLICNISLVIATSADYVVALASRISTVNFLSLFVTSPIFCACAAAGGMRTIAISARCIMCIYSNRPLQRNSRNYCVDSSRILLSDEDRQVYTIGCSDPEAKSAIYVGFVWYASQ